MGKGLAEGLSRLRRKRKEMFPPDCRPNQNWPRAASESKFCCVLTSALSPTMSDRVTAEEMLGYLAPPTMFEGTEALKIKPNQA
jgi:hypothetical protein